MVRGASVRCCRVRWALNVASWRPSCAQLQRAMASIQPEERARLRQLQFRRDWLASLAGRLMMRLLLTTAPHRTDLHCCHASLSNTGSARPAWRHVRLARSERGKPYVVCDAGTSDGDAGGWLFNVSHDGRYCVLAAEWRSCCRERGVEDEVCAVGCDVVHVRRHSSRGDVVRRLFDVMRRQFSDSEWAYITAPPTDRPDKSSQLTEAPRLLPDACKSGAAVRGTAVDEACWQRSLCRFYRCWALKESYVKALGCGVSMQLRRISFTCSPSDLTVSAAATDNAAVVSASADCTVSVDGRRDTRSILHECLLDADHIVAVTLRQCPAAVEHQCDGAAPFTVLSESELLERCQPLVDDDSMDDDTIARLIHSQQHLCEQLLARPYSARSHEQ